MEEEKVKSELERLESIDDILEAIRRSEIDVCQYMADIVSSLCNISKEDMLSKSEKAHIAHARWLFWYSYRYMTHETLEKIAEMTVKCGGSRFTGNGIGQCVNRMSALVESQPYWKKRWNVIKQIIKARKTDSERKRDSTIVIRVPKELKDNINIEITEK